MNARFLLAALLALGALVPAAPAAAQPAAQRDWTQVVATTPEGGFRMGNPECAGESGRVPLAHLPALRGLFGGSGAAKLMTYVRSGRVSLEYRNFVLNGLDVAAALAQSLCRPRKIISH